MLRLLLLACLGVAPLAAATVVCLGDSLTAGYGVAAEEAWPALLAERWQAAGVRVINAGRSGDTSRGGLQRLGWVRQQRPDLVIVALGANDGLRGLDPQLTERHLQRIIAGLQADGIQVVLAGMQLPTQLGADYRQRFAAIFPRLAEAEELPRIPFLLAGVAAVEELNQDDRIHPNAAGHRRIAETVAGVVGPLLGLPADEASP